ncbi:MAG: PD-(D/E)XK nuclease family protein [Candidatus Zixiibacteriota bacterium]
MLKSFSHSALNTFQACPRQFKFRYIDKPDVPEILSADLYLGSSVHLVLAQLYKRASDGVLWPLPDAQSAYLAEWNKPRRDLIRVPQEHMTVDDYIRRGQEMLSAFYKRYQPFNNGRLLGVETNLRATLPGTLFRINGKVDRLWRRPDNVVEIADYKTGNRFPAGPHDKGFFGQMAFYQILVQCTWPQFTNIEVVQYFLKPQEIIPYRFSPEELDQATEDIRLAINDIHNAARRDDFPATEGSHCNYCDYFKLCPAKRHELLLAAESGSDETAEQTSILTASRLADRYIAIDAQIKQLEAERDALRDDVIRTAKELQLVKLSGQEGAVSVKVSLDEKFIGKSKDADKFAELSFLARQFQLDDCFKLETNALMDLYEKQRLTSAQAEAVKPFIITEESARVSIHRRKKDPSEDDN